MAGPLEGTRILEIGGIGPVPFAGMMFADMGAEVIRIDRAGGIHMPSHSILLRGRRSLVLDLKDERARDIILQLVSTADALLEGFRPGVMERLGLGPDAVLARNPRLAYGRMTGWGQDGPLAATAGHDIDYISVAGALEPLSGPGRAPTPPLNMLGDFGGGSLFLVSGVLAAILSARRTGVGQVVDAAVLDGAALLTAMLHSMRAAQHWSAPPGQNLLDGGAPYYGVYATADGRWLAVGALEPQFYAQLLDGLGLSDELAGYAQDDHRGWPAVRERIEARVLERTRDEWAAVFDGTDACVSAVLAADEVLDHPHVAARSVFVQAGGRMQPAPAPRFAGTPAQLPDPVPPLGADTRAVLSELGLAAEAVDALIDTGVVTAC